MSNPKNGFREFIPVYGHEFEEKHGAQTLDGFVKFVTALAERNKRLLERSDVLDVLLAPTPLEIRGVGKSTLIAYILAGIAIQNMGRAIRIQDHYTSYVLAENDKQRILRYTSRIIEKIIRNMAPFTRFKFEISDNYLRCNHPDPNQNERLSK